MTGETLKTLIDDYIAFESRAKQFIASKGEARVCSIFDALFVLGGLEKYFVSKPVRAQREVQTLAGRVDRLLHHEDGSVTAVEVKDHGYSRDIATGIGQALLYATALRETLDANEIRPAIAIGMRGGKVNPWIEETCKKNGIVVIKIDLDMSKDIEVFYRAWLNIYD